MYMSNVYVKPLVKVYLFLYPTFMYPHQYWECVTMGVPIVSVWNPLSSICPCYSAAATMLPHQAYPQGQTCSAWRPGPSFSIKVVGGLSRYRKSHSRPQRPITTYGLQDAICWVQLGEDLPTPPPEWWDIIVTFGGIEDWFGGELQGYWNS